MEIKKKIEISTPKEQVWDVLANQFGEIDKWSSLISKSVVSGEAKIPGITYSVRSTETTQGPTKQEMTAFDPVNQTLAYKAIAGTPFFIKNVSAKWSLSDKENSQTELNLHMDIETAGLIGLLLTPIVKSKLSKLGDELLDDFKYYVETGKPHSRKVSAMNKN